MLTEAVTLELDNGYKLVYNSKNIKDVFNIIILFKSYKSGDLKLLNRIVNMFLTC